MHFWTPFRNEFLDWFCNGILEGQFGMSIWDHLGNLFGFDISI